MQTLHSSNIISNIMITWIHSLSHVHKIIGSWTFTGSQANCGRRVYTYFTSINLEPARLQSTHFLGEQFFIHDSIQPSPFLNSVSKLLCKMCMKIKNKRANINKNKTCMWPTVQRRPPPRRVTPCGAWPSRGARCSTRPLAALGARHVGGLQRPPARPAPPGAAASADPRSQRRLVARITVLGLGEAAGRFVYSGEEEEFCDGWEEG